MISSSISLFMTILSALLAMAFYTLLERKLLAYSQSRVGPNKVSLAGIPQPLADALKLFAKETSSPTLSNSAPFTVSPLMSLIIALTLWTLSPNFSQATFVPLSILLFLTISSLSVYSTLGAGWSSNSKYALLGALRSMAQTISYEVSMSLLLLSALVTSQTFDFFSILNHSHFPIFLILLPVFLMWIFTCVAETNRAPFDFAEGESELVSGFNTEYSAGKFALIFMAEYTSILVICLFSSAIFLQMPSLTFPLNSMTLIFTTSILASIFIMIRTSYPRLRYDLLMYLTWKSILPLSLTYLIFSLFTLSLI